MVHMEGFVKPQLRQDFMQLPFHMLEMSQLQGYDYRQESPEPTVFRLVGSTALIPVQGALTSGNEWWMTSYGYLGRAVDEAVGHSAVQNIVLSIDSPGGHTNQAFELADRIVKADKKKPCYALVTGRAFSAGYLLASACRKIYTSEHTGGVGSIGVFATHFDFSAMLAEEGIKVTLISKGKGKTDGNPYEPLSESAHAEIESEVSRLYGLFVGFVAAQRGLDESAIVKMGAKLFYGALAAKSSGLADGSMTLDRLLAKLNEKEVNMSQLEVNSIVPVVVAPVAAPAVTVPIAAPVVTPVVAAPAPVPAPAQAAPVAVVGIAAPARVPLETVLSLSSLAGLSIEGAMALHAKEFASVDELSRHLLSLKAATEGVVSPSAQPGGAASSEAWVRTLVSDPKSALHMTTDQYMQYLRDNRAQSGLAIAGKF